MKRFDGKVRLFCLSNIMVSFVGTGFLGINGYTESIEGPVLSAHEISLTASDTEPASQYGEGEDNFYALITEGIKVVIEEHQDVLQSDEEKETETTKKAEVKKAEVKKANTKKTTTKKTSTKKTTSKKSSSKSVTYTYNGTATGNAIVSYAKKFLGLRYRGGTPSLKSGADCSGFTMLIYKAFGINLPRSVDDQTKKGVSVSKSNLQKGDLVFFRPKGCKSCGISHVAIYIGGGQVIHETRPGRGVAITKIDGLSNIVFAKARRVLSGSAAKTAEKKVDEQKIVTDNSSNTNTTGTQNNKNEGNVNNNVVNNNTTTTNTTETNVVTPTPTPQKQETKVEVSETKVETKEESSTNGQ